MFAGTKPSKVADRLDLSLADWLLVVLLETRSTYGTCCTNDFLQTSRSTGRSTCTGTCTVDLHVPVDLDLVVLSH